MRLEGERSGCQPDGKAEEPGSSTVNHEPAPIGKTYGQRACLPRAVEPMGPAIHTQRGSFMNGRIIRTGVFIVALILAGGVWAQAQAQTVDVKFRFVAAGKTMEPGSYSIDFGPNGNVVMTPEKGGAAVDIPRIGTLKGRTVRRVELVFDVVGSMRFLSEVWLPEKGGAVVGKQADAAEQQTVSGPKK